MVDFEVVHTIKMDLIQMHRSAQANESSPT